MEKKNFSDRKCDSNTGQVCYKEFCQHSYIGQGYDEECFCLFLVFFFYTAVAVQAKSPVIP